MNDDNSLCNSELDKLANDVFFNEVIDGKKTPRFGLELVVTVAEALSIVVIAIFLLGYERFEVLIVFLIAGIISLIILRLILSFFDVFHKNNLQILHSFLKVQNQIKGNPKSVLSLIACGKLKGVVYLMKKILEEAVHSSGIFFILALVPYLLIVVVFLSWIEALVGAASLFCLVLCGHPLSILLQCLGWKIPSWYQRYIFLFKTCVGEYLHQKYLLFNQIFNFQFDMELFIQTIISILGGEFVLGFFHFALGCLNLSRFQEITNVDQLYDFYRSLTEGELKAGGIPHIIVKAPDADKMSLCAKAVSDGKLKLNAAKLKKLREAGLRFYVVGSSYESWNSKWWKAIYQAISITELKTSETLFSAFRRRTIFVSHRWDKTNTWHGEDSWQLEEVFKYINSSKQGKKDLSGDVYFWMDGICVPQESEGKLSNGIDLSSLTMLVIGNLAVLVRRCGQFICIDGTRGEERLTVEESNKYMNRAWCLYEIYHGRFLNPIQCSMEGASETLKVSVGHDFLHGFFNSFATDLSDKLHILKMIFLRAPLLFPNITHRPLIYLFESLMRQFPLLRVHRYEFVPISQIVAISMIINHIKSVQLCQQDPNFDEYTSALLSTEVKEFLDYSSFVSHGLGYLREYTLADLLDVVFIYEIEEYNKEDRSKLFKKHIDNGDGSGWDDTYVLKCGIFGLLADALISIDMKNKMCLLTFVHKVRVSTTTEFGMLVDQMASQSTKHKKEKVKKLACSSFPIQVYVHHQTNIVKEKTKSEKLTIVQEGLYSDFVSKLHFVFFKIFFFIGIFFYLIFMLIEPIEDVADHLDRMQEATCRIVEEGCYQKHTKGIYPGLRPSLTCQVNVTIFDGKSWVDTAEEWGTDNGMFGFWAQSSAIESKKAVEVGSVVPCFFAEPDCSSPLSFCRSISLNKNDNGAFDTLWNTQHLSIVCCTIIAFYLLCMILFGDFFLSFSWMKNCCNFGKRMLFLKPTKVAPSNSVDDEMQSQSGEVCSSSVKSFKPKSITDDSSAI